MKDINPEIHARIEQGRILVTVRGGSLTLVDLAARISWKLCRRTDVPLQVFCEHLQTIDEEMKRAEALGSSILIVPADDSMEMEIT